MGASESAAFVLSEDLVEMVASLMCSRSGRPEVVRRLAETAGRSTVQAPALGRATSMVRVDFGARQLV